MKFLLASLKNLLILNIVPKATSNFCSGFSLLSLFDFLQCTYIKASFRNSFQNHRWFFGTPFRVTGCYQKAGTSSLKRVTERVFTISKCFHGSKQKFHFGVSSLKDSQKLRKPSALIHKVLHVF